MAVRGAANAATARWIHSPTPRWRRRRRPRRSAPRSRRSRSPGRRHPEQRATIGSRGRNAPW